ncbi:Hypothetical protein NTJ_15376 [Nesidiocoris tenuis]|uniref:Uncharacterized protein n=1 Tax=Nesidiocoris tenuis TaxID=355587 RepID=A0ABN7BFS2_9HEMI|nr:Hypothetical protein NTJ_15376 [Nesidiocoris tenuis]
MGPFQPTRPDVKRDHFNRRGQLTSGTISTDDTSCQTGLLQPMGPVANGTISTDKTSCRTGPFQPTTPAAKRDHFNRRDQLPNGTISTDGPPSYQTGPFQPTGRPDTIGTISTDGASCQTGPFQPTRPVTKRDHFNRQDQLPNGTISTDKTSCQTGPFQPTRPVAKRDHFNRRDQLPKGTISTDGPPRYHRDHFNRRDQLPNGTNSTHRLDNFPVWFGMYGVGFQC